MNKIEKVLLKGFFENIALSSKTRMKVNVWCVHMLTTGFSHTLICTSNAA